MSLPKQIWVGWGIVVAVDDSTSEVFITNLRPKGATVQVRLAQSQESALAVSSPHRMIEGEDEGERAILVSKE